MTNDGSLAAKRGNGLASKRAIGKRARAFDQRCNDHSEPRSRHGELILSQCGCPCFVRCAPRQYRRALDRDPTPPLCGAAGSRRANGCLAQSSRAMRRRSAHAVVFAVLRRCFAEPACRKLVQHVRGRRRGGGDWGPVGVDRHGDGAGVQVQRRSPGIRRSTVDRIAQHRAAERGKVHAQLVGAPRARMQLEPCQALDGPRARGSR